MPTTREEYLSFCMQCQHQKFNTRKGVVCKFTNEHADFNTPECPQFELDPVKSEKYKKERVRKAELAESEKTMGLSQFGIKNGIAAGIIIIALSFSILFILLSINFLPLIFLYGVIILFISGVVILIRGISNERKKAIEKKQKNEDILDNDLR